MAQLLKGAPVAAALDEESARRAEALKQKGVQPTLAVVRVGECDDDVAYERNVEKRCAKVGIALRRVPLTVDVSQSVLEQALDALNSDEDIHGILLFRPLPRHMDEEAVCNRLVPEKDVDGITALSLAGVFTGAPLGFAPCTPRACMEILAHYGIALQGRRATVVGRSLVVGRPLATMLLAQNATVTLCHSHTRQLPACCREAEILIAALGKAGQIGENCLAPGQVVLDVGIHVDAEGQLCGDVDAAAAERIAEARTPVPGGVGTVTTAVLLRHVVEAAENAS